MNAAGLSRHPRVARDAIATLLLSKGIPDATLEADFLICELSGFTRTQLYTDLERTLTPSEMSWLEDAVERRLRREPLAHIFGSWEFFGLQFAVDRRVLVPRPETELLVELALQAISSFDRPIVADVGTGSGCIAVAIASAVPDARIYATDVSNEALTVAAGNIQRHRLESRITLLHGDLTDVLPQPVNVIVANLPYIETGSIDSLAPEVSCFEPRSALDGGAAGLGVISRLIAKAPDSLLCGGSLFLEVGLGQGETVKRMACEAFPGAQVSAWRDLSGIERVVWCKKASENMNLE